MIELRSDAQNVNAAPPLPPALSPFYIQNTHISLYIVADQK